jgi:hypothetical protein
MVQNYKNSNTKIFIYKSLYLQVLWIFECMFTSWLVTHTKISTALMAGLGEKLGTDLWIDQPARWRLCQEHFFSGAVALSIVVDDFIKGYHIRGSPTGSVHQTYVDWCGKRTCRVGRVFSCRVYIDSNHRDSRIWVTTCLWLPSSSNLLE